ncbi:MAG: alkaline phosphatase family protein, partial [Gemmataceae bacterium]
NGDKRFDIHAEPPELKSELLGKLGSFPFPSFWGPTAGAGSTAWISAAAAQVVREHQPDLTFVYLPHIDYEPQRYGPSGCDMTAILAEVDSFAGAVIDAADRIGASIFVVNEYVHCDVTRPVYLNLVLREAGFLKVRSGPFGELIDVYASAAFAVCDHQVAHVHTRPGCDLARLDQLLRNLPGVADIAGGPDRQRWGVDHPRAGDWVLMSEPDAWFAYPYWLDEQRAPDFARAVAIHQKPGYDPCELFWDPKLRFPKLRAARRLIQKKLGFRTIFDVVPLDASLVRGSHGRPASEPDNRPVMIGMGRAPDLGRELHQTDVAEILWNYVTGSAAAG